MKMRRMLFETSPNMYSKVKNKWKVCKNDIINI